MVRILTWNILHGGGRVRTPRILMEILEHRPDVVVVTEARRRFAGQLAGALADVGLCHAILPQGPDGVNGVMLVAREPLEPLEPEGVPEPLVHRWLQARMPTVGGLTLVGVHLPEASRKSAHREGWRHLLRAARALRDAPALLVGDLNTWRDGPDHSRRTGATATNLGRLAALGFVDTWLQGGESERGPTWQSHRGEAFRLDYVLVSAKLGPRIRGARVAPVHVGDRLSDHAAIVVDLATEP